MCHKRTSIYHHAMSANNHKRTLMRQKKAAYVDEIISLRQLDGETQPAATEPKSAKALEK
jgi:hypothetical protein